MERKTKQREIILQCILESTSHPTMTEISSMVDKIDSSIGQATIYRNVNKLVAEGKIVKISNLYDGLHYDGKTFLHDHFVCCKCFKIIDIDGSDYTNNKKKRLESKYSVRVDRASTVYEGVCSDCLQKIGKR